MLAGHQDPLSIHDLAEIRLQPEAWQQFIDHRLLSITFTPPYQPLAEQLESADEGFGQFAEPIHIKEEFTPTLPAPKQTLTLEQATLTQIDQPGSGQQTNLTQQIQIGQMQDNQTEYVQIEQTNTTEHLQIQAVQTQTNQPAQTKMKQAQAMGLPQTQQDKTTEMFLQNPLQLSHMRWMDLANKYLH